MRVFLDQGSEQRFDGINGDSNASLNADYVANLATFINDAAAAGIYTMVTLSSIPVNAYFDNITSSAAPNIETTNRYALLFSSQSSRHAFSSLHPHHAAPRGLTRYPGCVRHRALASIWILPGLRQRLSTSRRCFPGWSPG